MPRQKYIGTDVPISDTVFNGGLNSTGGPLSLGNNESSNLQNIDLSKFGSILKRNGYTALNTEYRGLLIHFDGNDGATTYTAETGQVVTFSGTAQLDTAQKVFGTSSLLMDGNSDYVTLPHDECYNFGTGDFTIEARVRWADYSGDQMIMTHYQTGAHYYWKVMLLSTGKIEIISYLNDVQTVWYRTTSAVTIANNTWYHIAVVRDGTSLVLYLDGVSQPLTAFNPIGSETFGDFNGSLVIGRAGTDWNAYYFNGWIEEVSISKGIARWTANFTPESSAYGIEYYNGTVNGLHWYEYNNAGTITRHAMAAFGNDLFKMDDLDGTWDRITGSLTITNGNHCDFENFLNEVYITNNYDLPFKWTGTGNASAMTVPSGLTRAKFVKQFNNYLFLANVYVSGVRHGSRIYYSNFATTGTWSATDYIDISRNDGQEITGIKVLSDRLVVYKTRSIYNVFFTGNSDIPFILPGGGKSNSSVGCSSGWSIQEVDNGHVFLSLDGFYFYDGNNSFKISDKINTTFLGMSISRLDQAVSLVQRNKNRYLCALSSSGQTENDRVFVWDYFNNAWSLYTGMAPASMATFYVSGYDERPYFGDYHGFVYRGDIGTDDYPLGVQTAINGIYYTNWRAYGDLVNKKGIPQIVIFYQNSNSVLTFSYSYDFTGIGGGLAEDDSDEYSNTIDLSASTDVYGTGVYGTATYAGAGGDVVRRDLTGRGRVIRFGFSNNIIGETFQIDGLGTLGHLETNV